MKAFIQHHPIITYFVIAFLFPYGGFLVFDAPKLLQGQTMQPLDALLLFPAIVIGVCLTGIVLTRIVDGRSGLRDLFSRISRWRVGAQWYAVLLIPPALILTILFLLKTFVSPNFMPHFFPIGIVFGLVAGFFEEIGWMGFVFPKLRLKYSALTASIILGVLWGLWHAPVVDYLAAAGPHKAYWVPFFLDFIALITALRVLIAWVYSNTKSVLLAQLLHASNTGFMVILGPAAVSAGQETFWYAIYAVVLWIVVAIVIARYGKNLVRQPVPMQSMASTIE